ncbi:MAG: DivIVA domain-containing protein [Actinomycetota bacterium]
MSGSRFRRVGIFSRGYDVDQVDEFFREIRSGRVKSAEIRSVGFDLRFGGYEIVPVDEALDRSEDEIATSERDGERQGLGDQGFVAEITAQAQTLRTRLARPHGDRFARGSAWERGYDIEQVDVICDEIAEYFNGARSLAPQKIRAAVFAPRRGGRGYSERAVDRFLDRVVAVMSRVS